MKGRNFKDTLMEELQNKDALIYFLKDAIEHADNDADGYMSDPDYKNEYLLDIIRTAAAVLGWTK